MPRAIPFAFCRYEFAIADQPLTGREQLERLRRIRGSMVAYRKLDPTLDDERNFVMRPKDTRVAGHLVLIWEVAEQKTIRERTRYDKDRDEIWEEAIETDEIAHTKFVAVPELGVLAVDDRLSDRTLGARPAVFRLKTIFEKLVADSDARITFAGSPQELQRALDTWTLDKFSFAVRLFNPHPSGLGHELHDLMVRDNIGEYGIWSKRHHG